MRQRHFTLIELITVIAIIGILAGIVIGGVRYSQSKSQHDRTIALMVEFQNALEEYHNDYGTYPIVKDAAQVNFYEDAWKKFVNATANKRGKSYLEGADGQYLDGFGNQFWYQYPNSVDSRKTTKFALWSVGADSKHGKNNTIEKAGELGCDDICSWNKN